MGAGISRGVSSHSDTVGGMAVKGKVIQMMVCRGRIDWKPRLKVWRVIWYQGKRDLSSGDYLTQTAAVTALREMVKVRRGGRAR